jgi:hypothetical protein
MIGDFINSFKRVWKYIPTGAWVVFFTMYALVILCTATVLHDTFGYSYGDSFLYPIVIYPAVFVPFIIVRYWLKHNKNR